MLKGLKSYQYLKNSLCFCLLFMCQYMVAQVDSVYEAQMNLLNEANELSIAKKYTKVIPIIDQVILNSETKNNSGAWHLRAYAYIQTYKQLGECKTQETNLLDTVIKSVSISMKLDSSNEYKQANQQIIKVTAERFHKLTKCILDDSLHFENYAQAEGYYNNYKKYFGLVEPNFDFKEKDIEFYNVLGLNYVRLYSRNGYNPKHEELGKLYLMKVLELDKDNINANLNLGILYYNHGVGLVKNLEYDIEIKDLEIVQENAKKLFAQSLPFMTKVYDKEPTEKRVLESLEGIYAVLLDEEKSKEFKLKKEALEKK